MSDVNTSADNSANDSQLTNLPDVDPKTLKQQVREISSTRQAQKAGQAMDRAASYERNPRNAAIYQRVAGYPPIPEDQLATFGMLEYSNINTGWLRALCERQEVRGQQIFLRRPLLTTSYLPETVPNGEKLSKMFQRRVSDGIRKWDAWNEEVCAMTHEIIVYGYGYAVWLNPDDWRWESFKQEHCMVEEGSRQRAKDNEVLSVHKDWKVSELLRIIKDRTAAEAMGWNVDQVVKCINNAVPKKPDRDGVNSGQNRTYYELISQGALGFAYETGATVVRTYCVWCTEASGKTSQWIVLRDSSEAPEDPAVRNRSDVDADEADDEEQDGDEQTDGDDKEETDAPPLDTEGALFYKYERYESMSDVFAPVCLETGDRTIYGSKGLGRKWYNQSNAVEYTRNALIMQLMLSGHIGLQTDEKNKTRQLLNIQSPFMFFDKKVNIVPTQLPTSAQGFFELDNKLSSIAESSLGIFLEPQMANGKESESATGRKIDATREAEMAGAVAEHLEQQFAHVVWGMQRRMCEKRHVDKADEILKAQIETGAAPDEAIDKIKDEFEQIAVECCYLLRRDGLTPANIEKLRKSPAGKVANINDSQELAAIAQFGPNYVNNPRIDQEKLFELMLTAIVGPDLAETLLLPVPDKNFEAEQLRQQLSEIQVLISGDAPETSLVSERDAHDIHNLVVSARIGKLQELFGQTGDPRALQEVQALLNHYIEHTEIATKMQLLPETVTKPMVDFIKATTAWLQAAVAKLQQAQAQKEAAIAAATAASQMPPSLPSTGAPLPPESNLMTATVNPATPSGAPSLAL